MRKSKKIVLLGHFGVGKTSLIRRFVDDTFSDDYKVTIGVHISKKVVEIENDEPITFILWDLEGTDEIQMIRSAYLLGTHAALFVFDVTRPSTFLKIKEDLAIIREKLKTVPLLVIGNKADLVMVDDLEKTLKEQEIPYDYLTSAKTGRTVDDVFQKLATFFTDHA